MNIFADQFNNNDKIRFVCKIERGKNNPSEEIQLGMFYKECIRLARDCNIYHNDFYVFKRQIHITAFGLFIRNLLLSGRKRIIIIPSYEDKGKYKVSKEYICYAVKPGENWWSISKRFCGIGSKYKALISYNNVSIENMQRMPKIIKIPYTLIKADSRTILQDE